MTASARFVKAPTTSATRVVLNKRAGMAFRAAPRKRSAIRVSLAELAIAICAGSVLGVALTFAHLLG